MGREFITLPSMAGFRSEFIKYTATVGSKIPHKMLTWLTGQRLIIPVYHLVSNQSLPHIKHVYHYRNVTDFTTDLEFFLKHYQPISLHHLMSHIIESKPLPKQSFLLTFDDGLREFADVIAPLLKSEGVPAVCFVNNNFIDNRDLFYRYKVSLVIEQLENNKDVDLHQTIDQLIPGKGKATLKDRLLGLEYDQTELINHLGKILGISFSEYLSKKRPYLTGPEIKHLMEQGFEFGAHSLDHPMYNLISIEEQLSQTITSIELLQKDFQVPYATFAFPFTDYGVSKNFFDRLQEVTSDLCITFGSAGLKYDSISTNLHRIPMEIPTLTAEEIIHSELLYFLAKVPMGKNRIRR